MNKYEQAKEILGDDLNQSLHHIIGYWYATRTDEVFDTELACCMIDICLKEMSNPLDGQLRSILDEAVEVIEFYGETGHWGTDLPGRETAIDPCDQESVYFPNTGPRVRGGRKARQFLEKYSDLINGLNRVKE